jgi:hypothetical protein
MFAAHCCFSTKSTDTVLGYRGNQQHYEQTFPIFNGTVIPFVNGSGTMTDPYLKDNRCALLISSPVWFADSLFCCCCCFSSIPTMHTVVGTGGVSPKARCTQPKQTWQDVREDDQMAYGSILMEVAPNGTLMIAYANQLGLGKQVYMLRERIFPPVPPVSPPAAQPSVAPVESSSGSAAAVDGGAIAGIVIAVIVAVCLCLAFVAFIMFKRKRKDGTSLSSAEEEMVEDVATRPAPRMQLGQHRKTPKDILEETGAPQLKGITLEKKIGSGAFGAVYKGKVRYPLFFFLLSSVLLFVFVLGSHNFLGFGSGTVRRVP